MSASRVCLKTLEMHEEYHSMQIRMVAKFSNGHFCWVDLDAVATPAQVADALVELAARIESDRVLK